MVNEAGNYSSDSDTSTEYISVVNVNSVKASNMDLADMLVNDKNRATFSWIMALKSTSSHGSILMIINEETTLKMWNKTTFTATGNCRLKLRNPKNNRKYLVEFMIVDQHGLQPLLGRKACRQMGLITVNHDQFTSTVSVVQSPELPPEDKYASVFYGSVSLVVFLVKCIWKLMPASSHTCYRLAVYRTQ